VPAVCGRPPLRKLLRGPSSLMLSLQSTLPPIAGTLPASEHHFPHMKRTLISRLRYLAALWLAGTVALAGATVICFQLGLNAATTSFVYLIVVVLLSLLDSFISSAVFSLIAVGCLNFFFVEPLYSY
jgi:K+-sensing histidine kinase KdpD